MNDRVLNSKMYALDVAVSSQVYKYSTLDLYNPKQQQQQHCFGTLNLSRSFKRAHTGASNELDHCISQLVTSAWLHKKTAISLAGD